MSARAMKWCSRQFIDDLTVTKILRELASASDNAGRVSLRQCDIANRIQMKERAVRSGLRLLEHFDMISRKPRGAKKAGRSADLTILALDRDFKLSKSDISDARRAGCPSDITGTDVPVAPTHNSGTAVPISEPAPTHEDEPGLYKERARTSNGEAADVEPPRRASARVWEERGEWRARLTYQGLTLDLGRHECRDLAEAECRVHLLDIDHSLRTKSGTPREPVIDPDIRNLSGEELWHWLNKALPGERDDRGADGHGVRGQSPGREFEGGSPHDPKDRANSAHTRAR